MSGKVLKRSLKQWCINNEVGYSGHMFTRNGLLYGVDPWLIKDLKTHKIFTSRMYDWCEQIV